MADLKVLGEQAFAKYPKVSHELLSLTYGALVAQVVAECETVAEANATLEQMGRKIGVRLVEEFLARSGISSKCKDFQETCNVIAKVRPLSFFLLIFPPCLLAVPSSPPTGLSSPTSTPPPLWKKLLDGTTTHSLSLDTGHSSLIITHLPPIRAQVGFKMYLGVAPMVTNWNQEKTECSLVFDELPFADFVELPQPQCSQLSYCSLICGVVEGTDLSLHW